MASPTKTKAPTLNSNPRSCRFICFKLHPRARSTIALSLLLRTSEQEILQNRIGCLLKLAGRTVEINQAFVQVSNVIGHVERVLHVVRHDNARHTKTLLQSPD